MREPALNLLIEKASNKYSLVIATANRAREIIDGDETLIKINNENPVSIATQEIANDLVHCNIITLNEEAGNPKSENC